MSSPRLVLLHCLVFCLHGSLAMPSGQPGTEAASDEPDLLHMLNFFKGKSDIGEITTLLKEYKVLEALGKGLFEVCALCREEFTNAAQTNVGIRILVKVIDGQAPGIDDLYELATKGTGKMVHDFDMMKKKNKNFNTISKLFHDNSTFESASLMEQLLDGFTGKSFTIDPILLKQVNDGGVPFTEDNTAQVNLLLLFSAIRENIDVLNQLEGSFAKPPPFDFNSNMEMLIRFNTSTISKIKILTGGMDNSKYTVNGGTKAFVTHPGVVKILTDRMKIQQQLKSKSDDQAKAETLVILYLSDLINLAFQIVKDAENTRSISPV